jgi:methionine aminotransferase
MAVAEFMAEQPDYAATLASFYQAKRDLFCDQLKGSRFSLLPSAGTYFQLLDYSEVSTEADTVLAQRWTREHKVASIPISVFYQEPPQQHFLRFCFAKNDDVLIEAAQRLCAI